MFWVAGFPELLLRGFGWGAVFALLVVWNLRRWETGKKLKISNATSGLMIMAISIPLGEKGAVLPLMGTLCCGAALSVGLFLSPFRRRLLEFAKVHSVRQPAREREAA